MNVCAPTSNVQVEPWTELPKHELTAEGKSDDRAVGVQEGVQRSVPAHERDRSKIGAGLFHATAVEAPRRTEEGGVIMTTYREECLRRGYVCGNWAGRDTVDYVTALRAVSHGSRRN